MILLKFYGEQSAQNIKKIRESISKIDQIITSLQEYPHPHF